jgi:arylsulfatase A-like enzyme
MPPGAEPVPAATPAGAGAGRPNVILVTVDTLRADHLSCYGYARRTSPAIDALASEGVLFAHALAQSSWTKPSTVSLLTSQYPTTHQTNLERSKVPPALTLLPEVLRAHGYTTAVFSGNPWVTPEYGFDQGVDHFHSVYDERFARETLFMPALKRVNNLVRAPAYNLVKRLVQSELSTTARDVDLVAQALRWLGESPPGPFFLYLHLMSPHHPYDPPPPFDRAFVTVPQDPPVTNYPRKSYFFGEQGEALADEKREDMVGRYDGDILFVDTVLGGFFAELRARGLLDRTVIVLTSDHGEEFFDHANWGHGHSVYDELLRVPLIVRHPALFPPGRVEGPVMSVDVMPTILELAGAAGTGPMAGRSLVAAMRGGEPAPGEAYAELLYRYGTGRALVRDHTKLVEITVEDRRRHELYDLGRDPREQRNLAAGTGAEPEFAGRLAEVTAWAERHRVDGAEAAITPEMEQRVRALGYVN